MEVKTPNFVKIYSKIDQVYNPQQKSLMKRWVLSLPGAGCSWAKKSGGCYMCGFKFATDRYTKGRLFPSWIFTNLYRFAWVFAKKEKPEELWFYNGGSFLNDQEIPLKAQQQISKLVAKSNIRKLLVETRPEFVTSEKLRLLTSDLGTKKLMLGIGLECVDDNIRSRCINKGFSKKDYEEALQIAKEEKAEVLTYVLLKPINLSEKNSIEEAVETIKYSFAVGSDVVALEPAFVQEGTVVAKLFKGEKYRPPWLWSILEVIKKTKGLGPIYVGGFEDDPPPIATSSNCSKCSKRIKELLQEYRETNDILLFDGLACECKEKWSEELKEKVVVKA